MCGKLQNGSMSRLNVTTDETPQQKFIKYAALAQRDYNPVTMTSTIKQALSTVSSKTSDNPKIADLQRDIIEPDKTSGLASDHGVFISDTDNW